MTKMSAVFSVAVLGLSLCSTTAWSVVPELSNTGVSAGGTRCVVVPQVDLDCTGAFVENEPFLEGDDTINGGCNSDPYVAQMMTDHICGSMFTYGFGSRDTDWYEFTLTMPTLVSAVVIADTDLDFNVYFVANAELTRDCTGVSVMYSADDPVDNTVTLEAILEPGEYWLWIGPREFGVEYMPVPVDYSAVVTMLPYVPAAADEQPEHFRLEQNYPNPFNPSTSIAYELPTTSEVQLNVFNMAGEHVASLVNGLQESGEHQISFDASALSSGVYFYTLQAEGLVQTRKMVLLK